MQEPLLDRACAKVNLTLRVLGRRDDGYHELDSLVAFADCCDRLALVPGDALTLSVRGSFAAPADVGDDNLVVRAARALAARVPGLATGAFDLDKRLPVAAGLGGGSADAAAALRLLARVNDLASDDPRLQEAARQTGADVPVCLDPRPRVMRGIGEMLSRPLALPELPVVLVNPGVPLATREVFAALGPLTPADPGADGDVPSEPEALFAWLAAQRNDLEPAAIRLRPEVADALALLRAAPGCRLARMSGSGATCFGLFESPAVADRAAGQLRLAHPAWWTHAGTLLCP